MRKLLPRLAGLLILAAGLAATSPVIGYFGPDQAPDTLRIVPPPPTIGSARDEADRDAFRRTRGLKDTPRWSRAQGDVDEGAILKDMSCALGVELTPRSAPRLTGLLQRMRQDVRQAVNRPKDTYQRKRPFLIDQGPICIAADPWLPKSPDYPSGHTTWGWSVALVLAELAPDRATEILVRGRSFGESRVVCGVHNPSAVEAGRTNASAVVAALHGVADFRADLDAARAEVAAARTAGPAPEAPFCAAEAKLIEATPY